MASSSDNWQSLKTLEESNLYMLENEILCDVVFVVGEKRVKIKCHKFMLVSRSCVFHAMFCGPMAEMGEEITLPDIEEDVLRMFLRYLYTDKADIQPDSVMGLLYAAKKYSVQTLTDQCCAYLEAEMTINNVCTILEQAHLFDERNLQDHCLDNIFTNSEEVFTTLDFQSLCYDCLKSIVASDKLRLKEEVVFSAIMAWAEKECRRKGVAVNQQNQREVLGDILFLVRFPNMSPEYFTATVSTGNILTAEEKVAIYQYYTSKSKTFIDRCKFSSKSRKHHEGYKIRRFQSIVGSLFDFWVNDNTIDAISFSCSRDITLTGISVFMPCVEGVVKGTVKLYDETNYLLAIKDRTELTFDLDAKMKDLEFRSGILIKKDMWYTITQQIMGVNTYFGKTGQIRVTNKGLTVSFRRSPMDRNNTDLDSGQIPGLLYK